MKEFYNYYFSNIEGLKSLRSFSETEFSHENIDFLLELFKLKRLPTTQVTGDILRATMSSHRGFAKQKRKLIVKLCLEICEKFILDSCQFPISMEDEVRKKLIYRYSNTNFTEDMFDEAKELILHIVETDVFQRYRKSSQFMQLLDTAGVYVCV